MHVHVSFIAAAAVFLAILPAGTLWRLIAMHLVGRSPDGTTANKIGRAMAVQY